MHKLRKGTAVAVFVISASFAVSSSFAGESGLKDRNDIYMQTSFEKDNWQDAWTSTRHSENVEVVSGEDAFQGNRHLRISVDKGDHYGATASYYFEDETGSEPEEVYFRYALRFPPSWIAYRGGKLPGFGGTYGNAGWGGRPANGDDGWSARMNFAEPKSGRKQGNTKVGFYTYHPDMTGTYGDSWYFSGGPLGADQGLEAGKWHQIEIYVEMNDPNGGAGTEGKRNGVLRGWVDGQKVFEKTDLRFRDISDLKIERIWANHYYGGSWSAPQDVAIEIDNVVIAENYIGPYDDSSSRERVGPQFSEVPHFGSRDNYTFHTPDRWSVVEEDGDERLFLRASDYEAPDQDLLGEWAVADDRSYQDFEMTGRVKTAESLSNNETADWAIVFGWEDPDNYLYILGTPSAELSSLIRVENGVASRIARASEPLVPDEQWHDIRVRYEGATTGRVEVGFDGTTVLETQLEEPIEGRVGVGSINDSSFFDDIAFRSLERGDTGSDVAERVDVGDTGELTEDTGGRSEEAGVTDGRGEDTGGVGNPPGRSDAGRGGPPETGTKSTGCHSTGRRRTPEFGWLALLLVLVTVERRWRGIGG